MDCIETKKEIIGHIQNIIYSSDDKIKTYLNDEITDLDDKIKDNIEELIMMSKEVHKRIFNNPVEKIHSINVDLAKEIQETIQSIDKQYNLPDDINAINAKIFDNYIKSKKKEYNISSNDFDFLSILSTGSGATGARTADQLELHKFLIKIQTYIYNELASASFRDDDDRTLLDLIPDNNPNFCKQYKGYLSKILSANIWKGDLKAVKTVETVEAVRNMGPTNSANSVINQKKKRELSVTPQPSKAPNSLQHAKAAAFTNLKARLLPQSPEKIVKPPPQIIDNHPDSLFRAFKEIIEEASNNYEIEHFFDKRNRKFNEIYENLSRTKLSKKEKIKILYLCRFRCVGEFADKLRIINDAMFDSYYIENILISYLNQNQHMIAIGMYHNNIEQGPDTKKPKSNLEIVFDFHNYIFVVTDKDGKPQEKIPVETQVNYLLHNVMMD